MNITEDLMEKQKDRLKTSKQKKTHLVVNGTAVETAVTQEKLLKEKTNGIKSSQQKKRHLIVNGTAGETAENQEKLLKEKPNGIGNKQFTSLTLLNEVFIYML